MGTFVYLDTFGWTRGARHSYSFFIVRLECLITVNIRDDVYSDRRQDVPQKMVGKKQQLICWPDL